MHKIYQRKCVNCKDKFTPQNNTQICCGASCAYEYVKKKNLKSKKQADKAVKESLMSSSEWLNIAQKVFNTYIRKRDEGKPCISCGKFLRSNDVNASHYFSVGAYPNLRFNEDNVHSSCIKCNKELHGNISEYALRLPLRIGIENYNKILEDRNKPLLLNTEDIKELILIYKQKTKELKNFAD